MLLKEKTVTIKLATPEGILVHKTHINNLDKILTQPDKKEYIVKYPQKIPLVKKVYSKNYSIHYETGLGITVEYNQVTHEFTIHRGSEQIGKSTDGKIYDTIKKALEDGTIISKIDVRPEDVKIEKILEYIAKNKALYSPFYTIILDENTLRVYTATSYFALKVEQTRKGLRFKTRLEENIFRSIITGRIAKELKTIINEYSNSIIIGNETLFDDCLLAGAVIRTRGFTFVQDFSSVIEAYVYKDKNIKIELGLNEKNAIIYITEPIEYYTRLSREEAEELLALIKKEGFQKLLSKTLPGLPIKYIKKVLVEGNTVNIEFDTGIKNGKIIAKTYPGRIKYFNIPYREGLYNITVPKNYTGDFLSPVSVKDIDPPAKASKRRLYTYPPLKKFTSIRVTDKSICITVNDYKIILKDKQYYIIVNTIEKPIDEILALNILREAPPKNKVIGILSLI